MAMICKTNPESQFTELKKESAKMGEIKDCTVVAVAIACSVSYAVAHEAMRKVGRKFRRGANRHMTTEAIRSLGYKATAWTMTQRVELIRTYPRPHNGLHGITSHHPRRFPAAWAPYKERNLLLFSRRHVLAFKDGVVRDWSINNSLRIEEMWEVEKA